MEFFCPSCGSANKTNISTGKSKLKTCGNCQNDFLAGDNNRAVSMESTTTIKACHTCFATRKGLGVCGLDQRWSEECFWAW